MIDLSIYISLALVFGLSHGYQGGAGMLSTGIVGLLLGVIFVWNGFSLWLPIFVHGFIDTVGISMIALGWDKALQSWVWGERQGIGVRG
jgi:hypothetical protein